MSDAAPTTERLAVEALPDRPRRAPLSTVPRDGLAQAVAMGEAMDKAMGQQPISSPEPKIIYVPQKPALGDQLVAAFSGIARILAVRFQLLLALIGAFALAVMAMQSQTPAGLYVLIADCVLTVLPLVWLEYSGRPR